MTSVYSDPRKCEGATETYGQFMRRVDTLLIKVCSMGHQDLADCAWWDLYETIHDEPSDEEFREEVRETACRYNEGLEALF